MAQGTITKMRLGRDDRNTQVFLMDKRRARSFGMGLATKNSVLRVMFFMYGLIKLEVSGNNAES